MMTESPAQNWDELLAAARGGDAVAIAQLLLETRRYLRLIAGEQELGPLRSKLSESDLVQESLLEIARNLTTHTTDDGNDYVRWTERVLLHNLVDAKRRFIAAQQRDVRREVPLGEAQETADTTLSASGAMRRSERDQRLEQAIAALPENYRTVLQLRHEQQLHWNEIGAQLGVSAEAARKLWARAVQKLQRQLDEGESNVD